MLQINYRDSRPIYEQLQEQFRKLIVSGVIKPDEKLPSIREISASYAINPNTISRAYHELENDGYIYTIQGKGSFVSPNNHVDTKREAELLKKFDEIALELYFLGQTSDDLQIRIDHIIRKESEK